MKIRMWWLAALVLLLMVSATVVAEAVSPCADAVFWDASINIMSSGDIYYTASTRSVCDAISVSNCRLQQYVDGSWTTIATLPSPTSFANTQSYLAYTDCSAYFSTGKYRVIATFWADDYSITRTSNERTFSK